MCGRPDPDEMSYMWIEFTYLPDEELKIFLSQRKQVEESENATGGRAGPFGWFPKTSGAEGQKPPAPGYVLE